MFAEDEELWDKQLQQVRKESFDQQERLKDLLGRQKSELSTFLHEGLVMNQSYSLKRLPCWGSKTTGNQISFVWPTPQEFD